MSKHRTPLGLSLLVLSTFVLALRVHQLNQPPAAVQLAPRAYHVLYLDSLRGELLTFAEQYGRPLFYYDTTPLITGHGRIKQARLREALFDPRVEYVYGDEGFHLDWRSDPKPRVPHGQWMAFGSRPAPEWATPWPAATAEYAKLRRIAITPQWPEPPARRPSRDRGVKPQPDGLSPYFSAIALY